MKRQTLFGLMEAPINLPQYFIFPLSKFIIIMKKIKKNLITAFVLFVFIGLHSASAQTPTTHTGDLSVVSQTEVDALSTSLTAGATRIMGNVTIGPATGTSDITDLSPLAAITEITGNVVVRRNPDLTNLMGVTQLQIIGGNLQFSINVDLQILGNFSALQSIGGAFIVEGNNDLRSLGGFTSLTSIGSADGIFVPSTGTIEDGVSIMVEGNDALLNCCVLTTFLSGAANPVSGQIFINNNATGCNSTTEVNCDPFLQVDQTLVFVAKTATESTLKVSSTRRWQLSKPNTGAEWITNIVADGGNSDASSIIRENDAFITITTTANPSDAGRSTTLTLKAIDMDDNALTDPVPITIFFTQLGTTHTGDITLRGQSSVDAFPSNVTAIQGDLIISFITNNLLPLSGITHVTGNVVVKNNFSLVSLGPLGNLQSIGGDFEVNGNDVLTSMGNFPALQTIGGTFEVNSNAALTSLEDFSALQIIGDDFVVGGRFFGDSNLLTSLGDFSALQSIGGHFVVGGSEFGDGNNALTSLGDFSALQTIRGSFEVSRNRSLPYLGDFSALQSIGGSFNVEDNSVLTSLGGFPMLASIGEQGGSIKVEGNDRLQDCCVLTEFLSGATNAVSGKVFIGDNAPGCNSTTQVNCDPFLQVDQKVVFAAKTAGEGTFEIFAGQPWQLSKPNTGAEWITNIAAGGGTSNASSITGENHAFITITTTANPSDAGRSTTLTLRTIDQAGNALTDPLPVTILFTQLGTTHTGSIRLESQAEVNALILPANATVIQGNLIIGNGSGIGGASDITDLRPLSGITHVTGRVEVVGNSRLVSLGPLGNLQSIGGSFEVGDLNYRNNALTSLGDFPSLQTIGGRFVVDHHRSLTSLGNFPALQSIGDRFQVWSNSSLTSLGDFSALQTIGSDFEVFNAALTFLGGFTSLQSIGGSFEVSNNAVLISLGDFNALQSIGGSFEVRSTDALTSLGDFPALQSIGGSFEVGVSDVANSGNEALTSLGDFSALESIGGSFSVSRNRSLTSFGDFSALQSIEGSFSVGGYRAGNGSLTSLGDFTALQSIGGSFSVFTSRIRTSLGDFPALRSIGGTFQVIDNSVLTSLGRFPMLASIGNTDDGIFVPSIGGHQNNVSILVEDNDRLQDCCLLTAFLSGAANAVSGKVFINRNAPGCSSEVEINPCGSQTIAFTSTNAGNVGVPITLVATATSTLPVTFAITAQAPTSATGDVATLAAGVLTLVSLGEVTITATQAGGNSGGLTYPLAMEMQIITVSKGTQTITFNEPSGDVTGTVGDDDIALAATTGVTGLDVSFAINPAAGVAMLTDAGDGTGSLTLNGVGMVTVTASQMGNATYSAATDVTRTITVEEATTVLGIEATADGFVLYPNPTSGKLHFSEQVGQFRLYGIEGRLLETRKNVLSVDLSARPAGLYFAEVIRDGRSVRYRILRE